MSGTDLNSSFVSDKQAMLESLGSISTPKAIRYTNTHIRSQWLFFSLFGVIVLIALCSSCSVELLMERASSVSGRSTRHPPTQNHTWYGRILPPSTLQQTHTHF